MKKENKGQRERERKRVRGKGETGSNTDPGHIHAESLPRDTFP